MGPSSLCLYLAWVLAGLLPFDRTSYRFTSDSCRIVSNARVSPMRKVCWRCWLGWSGGRLSQGLDRPAPKTPGRAVASTLRPSMPVCSDAGVQVP